MSFHLIESYQARNLKLIYTKIGEPTEDEKRLFGNIYRPEIQTIKSEKRKNEIIHGNYLKNSIFPTDNIIYSTEGIPELERNKNIHISISHTLIYIGMIFSDFNIGLDIEKISERLCNISGKFMNTTEKTYFDANSNEDMTILWTMKEAMYKLARTKGVSFHDDIFITKRDDEYFGQVKINGKLFKTKFITFIKENHIFSFNSEPLVQE